MIKLDPIASTHASKAVEPTKVDPKLHRAAQELESVFVRQLLEAAKITGDGKGQGQGYGSMAVDALATGVQAGGGVGLARQIEEMLSKHDRQPAGEMRSPTVKKT